MPSLENEKCICELKAKSGLSYPEARRKVKAEATTLQPLKRRLPPLSLSLSLSLSLTLSRAWTKVTRSKGPRPQQSSSPARAGPSTDRPSRPSVRIASY